MTHSHNRKRGARSVSPRARSRRSSPSRNGIRRIHRVHSRSGASSDLWMTPGAYSAIASTIGALPAEQGGPLGGDRRTGIVESFVLDTTAERGAAIYTPDTRRLNRLFKTDWNPRGVSLLGFIHSHPAGSTRPSTGDRKYARDLLTALPALDRLQLPIVQSAADGPFALKGFAASSRGSDLPAIHRTRIRLLSSLPSTPTPNTEVFSRVKDAYDLGLLASTRVIIVGAGGAAAYAENLVRCGVGEIVLIDPDTVEAPNIATQQTYLSDIGRPKVDAIADRLVDISPLVEVAIVQARFEELHAATLRQLLHRPMRNGVQRFPRHTLLCAFTDDFWTQAEVARVALQEGVPLLAAQVYRSGAAAEIVFVAPGHTAACHRCVLRTRYEAFLNGFTNDVGSSGTPLFATERLNATKALITMAMLHSLHPDADPAHPAAARHRALFERIRNRNLVQIRLDPNLRETLGLGVFDRVFAGADAERIVCDETLWLPQEPEDGSRPGGEPCPDCGGTGDLARLAGEQIEPLAREQKTSQQQQLESNP